MSEIKTAEQRIHKLEGGEGDSFVTFEQALIAERDELRAALAERDAKLAKFAGLPMKYKRMEFNAALQKENDELRAKLAALETHNTMLRACIKGMIKVADRKTDEFDTAKELLEAGAAPVPTWVSVTEGLPERVDVEFYSPDMRNPCNQLIGRFIDGRWMCAGYEMVNVTHWKPLAAAPKEAS